jgi:hypothetical protein
MLQTVYQPNRMANLPVVNPRNIPAPPTPWEKVLLRFNRSQKEMASLMGRDPSRISRAINERGIIHHNHQVLLLKLAKRLHVDLRPTDLLPEV